MNAQIQGVSRDMLLVSHFTRLARLAAAEEISSSPSTTTLSLCLPVILAEFNNES